MNVSPSKVTPSRTVVTTFSVSAATPGDYYDNAPYVLHVGLVSKGVTCALSDGGLHSYDRETLRPIHSIARAHDNVITDLCSGGFGPDDESTVFASSGRDGTVRLFDLRAPSMVAGFHLPKQQQQQEEEALSVAIGYGGTLAAVGSSKSRVHFYDLRALSSSNNSSSNNNNHVAPLGSYVDAHTDEVTCVRFQPTPTSIVCSNNNTSSSHHTTSLLVSASEDGLACLHDTSCPTEESALKSVLNVGSPLRNVGFFGPGTEGLYCLTGSETLSCWHHDSAQRLCEFGSDLRSHLSSSLSSSSSSTAMTDPISYLIGCHWDHCSQELRLLAGTTEGDVGLYRIDANTIQPMSLLKGGHKGCIRDFVHFSTHGSGPMAGSTILTAGEDARLCEWTLSSSSSSLLFQQRQQQQQQQQQQQRSNSKASLGPTNGFTSSSSSSSSVALPQAMPSVVNSYKPQQGGGRVRRERTKIHKGTPY